MTHIRISKAWWPCSLVILLHSFGGKSQQNELSFLFVGDVMQHDGQIEAAFNAKTNSYEYDNGFQFVKPIINAYDIRVANLEVTLAGKPYKGYPQFSAPDELAETLQDAGFNVILTANNHSCDRGDDGVIRTLDKLDQLGIKHTGTFRNKKEREENYPLIIEEKGMKVALLNYTYGTNGLTVSAPLIVNYIDSTVIKEDIKKAQNMGADYIICNMHWGLEYKFLPNNYQKRFESYCYELGADMVIGGHPHVVQPIEKKVVANEDKFTVWSLGNFVSNMRTRPTRGGVMVGATIEKKGKVQFKEATYHLVYTYKKNEGEVTQYYILPDFDYNKFRPGFLNEKDLSQMSDFLSDSRKLYSEHNKGINESLLHTEKPISDVYERLLTRYYSVLIPEADAVKIKRNKLIQPFIHQTVVSDGTVYTLSGNYASIQEAKANSFFILDCGITVRPIIVEVKPESLVKLKE